MQQKHALTAGLAGAWIVVGAGFFTSRLMSAPQHPAASSQSKDAGDEGRAATPAERKAATTSIRAQLDAFAKNDYKHALVYQSAALRHNFADAAAFRAMMQSTYPQFAHYKTVTFGDARSDAKGEHIQILATVMGRDGVKVQAAYLMVLEQKIYRIDGVMGGAHPLDPPQASPHSRPTPDGDDANSGLVA